MPELIPVLDKNAIARKVAEVARQISSDYHQEGSLVLIGVLKGAFIFLADLARNLDMPQITIDFVQLASYGTDSTSSGRIRVLKDVSLNVEGRDLLIVEDILDTGLTLAFLLKHLSDLKPRSIKICAMIDKRERRLVDVQADYVCHTAEDGFLVGYGLDYAEAYRNLPGIFHLKM